MNFQIIDELLNNLSNRGIRVFGDLYPTFHNAHLPEIWCTISQVKTKRCAQNDIWAIVSDIGFNIYIKPIPIYLYEIDIHLFILISYTHNIA